MDLPTPYRDAAHLYRAAGWIGVLPIPYGTKRLRAEQWTGHRGHWPSGADIQAWTDSDRRDEGGGNIALRMPPDVIGIDVDQYDGKTGADTLAQAIDKWGPLPPTSSSTARGDGPSRILFFRVPEGLRWPGNLGNHVELIQMSYRYAMVWPSMNPQTGTLYRWYTPDGLPTLATPRPDELPELPDLWIVGLTGGELAEEARFADLTPQQYSTWLATHGTPGASPCRALSTVRDRLLLDLATGSAHESLRRLMGLVRFAEQGHTGLLHALGEVHSAFLREATRPDRHGKARDPQEAEKEWRRSLDGATSRVLGNPSAADGHHPDPCLDPSGGLLPPTAVPSPAPAQPSAPDGSQAREATSEPSASEAETEPRTADELRATLREAAVATELEKMEVRDEAKRRHRSANSTPPPVPVLLPDFLAVPDEPVLYRVEGLMPVGARVMLAAQFKAGKSSLTANFIRSLADGTPFLDREVFAPDGRIVLLDAELDERMLRRWLRDQGIQKPDRVAVISLRGRVSSFNILDPHTRAAWADVLRSLDPSMVFLDCLRPVLDAIGLDEDKDAGRFVVAFDELLEAAGVPEGLVVHHMGHTSERGRGSSRLRDWPDVEWRLVRQDDDPSSARYFAAYGRDVDVPEMELGYNTMTRQYSIIGGNRKEAKGRAYMPAIVELLHEQDGLSGRQIESQLTEVATRAEIRDALRLAIKERIVWTSDGPKRAILHHLSAPVRGSAP